MRYENVKQNLVFNGYDIIILRKISGLYFYGAAAILIEKKEKQARKYR